MYGRYGQWLDATLNGASPLSWGKAKGSMPVRDVLHFEFRECGESTRGVSQHSKAAGKGACACRA